MDDVKNLWYYMNKKKIDRMLYELEVQRMRGTVIGDSLSITDIKQMFIGLINEDVTLSNKLESIEKENNELKEKILKLENELKCRLQQ